MKRGSSGEDFFSLNIFGAFFAVNLASEMVVDLVPLGCAISTHDSVEAQDEKNPPTQLMKKILGWF